MTNWEKFKEVFGLPENDIIKPFVSVCIMMKCRNVTCDDCPIFENDMSGKSFWNREYNKESEEKQ